MPALANIKIEKVWPGTEGDGESGHWKAYNFKIKGHTERFGYFQSGNKPIPEVGMILEVLQYTTEENTGKNGKVYTNHKVGKLEVVGGSTPAQGQKPAQSPSVASGKATTTVNGDTKSIQVALNGIVHGASGITALLPEGKRTIEDLADACIIIFQRFKDFAESYRPDIEELRGMAKAEGLQADEFMIWLSRAYSQHPLSGKQVNQTIRLFSRAAQAFVDQTMAEEEAKLDQRDEEIFGPENVQFPEEEVAPTQVHDTDDAPPF